MAGPVTGSTWEQNIYNALTAMKMPFEIQVPELGGWAPGGTIIDFVIYKPGAIQPIALFVDGPRWHNAKKAPFDLQKRKNLEKIGYMVMAVEDESETLEGSIVWLRKNL